MTHTDIISCNRRHTPYHEGARSAIECLKGLLHKVKHEQPKELVKRTILQLLPASKIRSRVMLAVSKLLSNCVVVLARTLFHAIHRPGGAFKGSCRLTEGYQLFREEYCKLIGDSFESRAQNIKTALVDSVWSQLSFASKQHYERQAERLSFIHESEVHFQTPGVSTMSVSAISFESEVDSYTDTEEVHENLLEKHEVWCKLVEGVQLEIIARSSLTLGDKVFRLYRLSSVSARIYNLHELRKMIEDEFISLHDGKCESKGPRSRSAMACRVYATMPCTKILWIQLNLGRSQHDCTRGKLQGKKGSSWAEYHAVLRCDGKHLAMAGTGPASTTRLTRLVLASLESAIAHDCVEKRNCIKGSGSLRDVYCSDPLDLLRSSGGVTSKNSSNLLKLHASQRNAADPVSYLESTAKDSLLRRQVQRNAHLAIPRAMQLFSKQVRMTSGGHREVAAITKSGILLDYTPRSRSKRKFVCDRYFGDPNIRTKRTRLRLDVSNIYSTAMATTATSSLWKKSNESREEESKEMLKCRIVLQGTDVLAGLRLLLQSGETCKALPKFWESIPGFDES